MSVKLTNQVTGDIPVHEMKDGQIAVIKWAGSPDYIGRIVQRYGDRLITIGMKSKYGWSNLFEYELEHDLIVRLLQPGETITITEN